MEYKYVQHYGTVIRVPADTNYRIVVDLMRAQFGPESRIMIEDIHPAAIEDYVSYLESANRGMRSTIASNEKLFKQLHNRIDELNRKLNPNVDQSLPF